jgi:hypothetical protein
MWGIIHPIDRKLYERDGNGNIKVSKDGVWGIFAIDGRHLEGEMYECDPQLCGWVGGPKYTNARLDKSADRTA